MTATNEWREHATIVALCVLWYAASSASNVVGKVVLSELPLPLTLSLVQLVSAAVLSAACLDAFRIPRPHLPRRYWRVLIPLAIAKLLTTAASQVSIWKVPVSYAHTVKATTPLWTAALSWALLGERPSSGVLLALALIVCGVCVASLTELQFDMLGMGAALTAAVLISLQHIYSKQVMREWSLHPLRLLERVSGGAALVLLAPVWAWMEGGAALEGVQTAGARIAALLAADGTLAYIQAVLAFSVLWRVSPLTYAVASAAKRVAVVAASVVVLRNPVSAANGAGMALAALGVLVYNRAKLRRPLTARPLLPV
ncbi:Solute carrier family 35 member E1 homolog [Eumeta japonica]|uniref:Solute carrier family 35 member E1 homolog n=1 Tax=Eumeta variegata TaxID=151549 RepID=A0A4C2A176_EUMVA|nr:Solute carrier family 35 member E1 homolog [Eumeta japonica]